LKIAAKKDISDMIVKNQKAETYLKMLNGNAGQKYLKGHNYAREIIQST